MALSVRIFPPVPTRPCRFCLSLQDDSVFSDFDCDDEGHVFLRRISFDGFGCCSAPEDIKRMNIDESRALIGAIDRGATQDPQIEVILRAYIHKIRDVIWSDALACNDLL